MKIDKLIFTEQKWRSLEKKVCDNNSVDIIFVFGNVETIEKIEHHMLLKNIYPNADILSCSTAGNILDTSIDAYEAVATAISFDTAFINSYAKKVDTTQINKEIDELVAMLDTKDLKHILLFAPGLINGSELLDKLELPKGITISGGLAGDNFQFKNTFIGLNDLIGNNVISIVGLYGDSLHIAIGCETGWQEFGAKRVVTKSEKNTLYELDHKPAIDIYKLYLGEKIKELPNSALRFSLSVRENINDKNRVIRAMIKKNEDDSLVYAGNIKEGSIVQLMKINVANVLDGAFLSAKKIRPFNTKQSLSLAISCATRRCVLNQLAEEEIEIIQDILTQQTQIIGFYSYGEIAPFSNNLSNSLLHNQTMTITTIYEE
jgi:hypothetical protein